MTERTQNGNVPVWPRILLQVEVEARKDRGQQVAAFPSSPTYFTSIIKMARVQNSTDSGGMEVGVPGRLPQTHFGAAFRNQEELACRLVFRQFESRTHCPFSKRRTLTSMYKIDWKILVWLIALGIAVLISELLLGGCRLETNYFSLIRRRNQRRNLRAVNTCIWDWFGSVISNSFSFNRIVSY